MPATLPRSFARTFAAAALAIQADRVVHALDDDDAALLAAVVVGVAGVAVIGIAARHADRRLRPQHRIRR